MIAKPERLRRKLRRLALMQARLEGCNCTPKVELGSVDGALAILNLRHDDYCAVLRLGQGYSVVLIPRSEVES